MALLAQRVTENKDCEWIYRFRANPVRANPGRPWGGMVPPSPVLAPGSALGSRPRVALSSAQAPFNVTQRALTEQTPSPWTWLVVWRLLRKLERVVEQVIAGRL